MSKEKEIKIATPPVGTRLSEAVPRLEARCRPLQHNQNLAEVLCPHCGSRETGYYEIEVRRVAALVDTPLAGEREPEPTLWGESYGSVVDNSWTLRDADGRTVFDCNGCGRYFSVSAVIGPDKE